MYHCHIGIYIVGNQSRLSEIIKGMGAFDSAEHEFTESRRPEKELAEKADLILADLKDMDAADTARTLTAWKRQEADLILLA